MALRRHTLSVWPLWDGLERSRVSSLGMPVEVQDGLHQGLPDVPVVVAERRDGGESLVDAHSAVA